MSSRSSIAVSIELRKALNEMGKKSETYEDIIWRLIKERKKEDKITKL